MADSKTGRTTHVSHSNAAGDRGPKASTADGSIRVDTLGLDRRSRKIIAGLAAATVAVIVGVATLTGGVGGKKEGDKGDTSTNQAPTEDSIEIIAEGYNEDGSGYITYIDEHGVEHTETRPVTTVPPTEPEAPTETMPVATVLDDGTVHVYGEPLDPGE